MEYKFAFLMLVLFRSLSMTSVTLGQSLSGCGVTKGCFNQPPSCTGDDDCTAYVTWQTVKDGQTEFALWGEALGWVAFGLRPGNASSNNMMVPADVYACTKNSEVQRSQNVNRIDTQKLDSVSREIPNGTITVIEAEFEEDVISCMFTRESSSDVDITFYNISGDNTYFIILAVSDTLGADGTIESHIHKEYWAASQAIKLQATLSLETDNSGTILRKAHASLMVIAWVGLASIGITLARYFKPMWPSSKLLGKAVWFTVHRACMVVCVLCTVVGLVVIVIHVQGFVETGPGNLTKVLHAVFGIIVTILSIINPIMAIFRPPPGDDRRPVFNWAHWGVGSSAYVIGLVTIFLGIGYKQSLLSSLPHYVFFIMIAFVVFHCLLWILFEIQQCMTESRGRDNDVPLGSIQGGEASNLLTTDLDASDEMADGPRLSQVTEEGLFAKTLLLTIYALGVIIAVVFFVISFILV